MDLRAGAAPRGKGALGPCPPRLSKMFNFLIHILFDIFFLMNIKPRLLN